MYRRTTPVQVPNDSKLPYCVQSDVDYHVTTTQNVGDDVALLQSWLPKSGMTINYRPTPVRVRAEYTLHPGCLFESVTITNYAKHVS